MNSGLKDFYLDRNTVETAIRRQKETIIQLLHFLHEKTMLCANRIYYIDQYSMHTHSHHTLEGQYYA